MRIFRAGNQDAIGRIQLLDEITNRFRCGVFDRKWEIVIPDGASAAAALNSAALNDWARRLPHNVTTLMPVMPSLRFLRCTDAIPGSTTHFPFRL
jgi:hypothetical protein